MSSIKVKIAEGGSYFISSAGNDLPTNLDFTPQRTDFTWGGQNQSIQNYKVDDSEDIVNWNSGIEMAYNYICLFPSETGYPNLGADITNSIDIVAYLTLDGTESMSRVVKSLATSDTEIVDFSLIYSWSTVGSGLTTDDYKVIIGQLNTLRAEAANAATTENQNCLDAFAGGATSYTWPDGFVCTSTLCCEDHEPIYQSEVFRYGTDGESGAKALFDSVGVTAEDITKKHIYKFKAPEGSN